MRWKKRIVNILIILTTIILLMGCNIISDENVKINIFNSTEAIDIAKEYLENINKGEVGEASKLCVEEIIANNKELSVGTSKIVAYNVDSLIEKANSVYIVFNVLRSSSSEPKCDLDSIAINVAKVGEEYKITEVKSINKKQIFVKNEGLRVIDEGAGNSQLIINLKNMPKDVYLRENEVMLYKETSPRDAFGMISLSYTGQKIAISTVGENNVLIAIGYLDESKPAQGSGEGETSNEAGQSENLQDLLQKPIAKKIVTADLLKDVKIQNLIFSQEEDELIVEYIDKLGVKRIKIYKTEDGTLAKTTIDEIFSVEKYHVVLNSLDKNTIYINVIEVEGSKDIDKNILGTYKLDLETLEITKK
ncbi:MAG: hypothetical protein ACRC68_05220 [Clostridium sp.]